MSDWTTTIVLRQLWFALPFLFLIVRAESQGQEEGVERSGEANVEERSGIKSSGVLTLFGELYDVNESDTDRRPDKFGRVELNSTLTFGSTFTLPLIFAVSTTTGKSATSEGEQRTFWQTVSDPENNVSFSPTFNRFTFHVGSHTPQLSELTGSTTQIFGLGSNIYTNNLDITLSGGITQPHLYVGEATSGERHRSRTMFAGRVALHYGEDSVGLNLLFAKDSKLATEKVSENHGILNTNFLSSLSTDTSSTAYQTIAERTTSRVNEGDILVILKNGKAKDTLIVREPDTIIILSGTHSGEPIEFRDTNWTIKGGGAPYPLQNLVASMNTTVKIGEHCRVWGEGAISITTENINDSNSTLNSLDSIPKFLKDMLNLNATSHVNFASNLRVEWSGKLPTKEDRGGSKPMDTWDITDWKLRLDGSWIGPGYFSAASPWMKGDQLDLQFSPEISFGNSGSEVNLRGNIGWSRDGSVLNIIGFFWPDTTEERASSDISKKITLEDIAATTERWEGFVDIAWRRGRTSINGRYRRATVQFSSPSIDSTNRSDRAEYYTEMVSLSPTYRVDNPILSQVVGGMGVLVTKREDYRNESESLDNRTYAKSERAATLSGYYRVHHNRLRISADVNGTYSLSLSNPRYGIEGSGGLGITYRFQNLNLQPRLYFQLVSREGLELQRRIGLQLDWKVTSSGVVHLNLGSNTFPSSNENSIRELTAQLATTWHW
ncbi:MAG: hypothetical protein KDD67_16210 [Ignavibacteriae bacterium]|nr:hypothetical protein [Ignavibacteriota bacterium]MCB9216828.1 hypothetical protein [Ignavibacteria bacterium]